LELVTLRFFGKPAVQKRMAFMTTKDGGFFKPQVLPSSWEPNLQHVEVSIDGF
jgi:hypothetical protein